MKHSYSLFIHIDFSVNGFGLISRVFIRARYFGRTPDTRSLTTTFVAYGQIRLFSFFFSLSTRGRLSEFFEHVDRVFFSPGFFRQNNRLIFLFFFLSTNYVFTLRNKPRPLFVLSFLLSFFLRFFSVVVVKKQGPSGNN